MTTTYSTDAVNVIKMRKHPSEGHETLTYTSEREAWAAFEGFQEDCDVTALGLYATTPNGKLFLLDSYQG